jgi:hypothetical protein
VSEFGYIPESPEQSFQSNKGILTPTDIYDLTRADKYTNYGQLELIETQTVTSTVSYIDFTSIQESTYNVHLLTVNDLHLTSDFVLSQVRFSNDGGTSFFSSGYYYARQRGQADGTFAEDKSTSWDGISFISHTGNATNENANGFMYLYNLGDSTKYSFATMHSITQNSSNVSTMDFGNGVYPVANEINAIRLYPYSSTFDSAVVSLYGIKEYS